jgi:hypothetical protein
MELSVKLHALDSLPQGKELPVPIGQETGWGSLDDVKKRIICYWKNKKIRYCQFLLKKLYMNP